MERKLKLSYRCLDLPYQATAEEVKRRERALIKIFTAKAKEKNISYSKQIDAVQKASDVILENIKNNGIPTKKYHRFEASVSSIITLSVLLAFAIIMCVVSFIFC